MKKRLITILVLALVMVLSLTSCEFFEDLFGEDPPAPEVEYAVYFISNGGTHVSAQDVKGGGLVTRPEDPTREGYTFENWYKDAELTTLWNFETDTVSQNTMIYAKWTQNPHECESVCEECGKCTDAECTEDVCADKCAGHHTCESVCDECGKCTDKECAEEVCADKCGGHVKNATFYLVGDSTVCSFADDYYYPRYGWGTQIGNYLTDKATVVNLALSGRSSKSFISEENYQTLVNSIKEGDVLLIAFGHNDEKSDDAARFTDARLGVDDEGSFAYYLYNYYIKLAEEKGATAILVTPIVRAKSSNDYTGNEGHITATGDYRQAIIDLGAAKGVDVIDMTAITRARYEEIGYDEAIKYHALIHGKKDGDNTVENWDTVDKTHLNIYGAKYVAYNVALELAKLDGVCGYVADGIAAPTEADRVPNPDYVVPDYLAPDLENYTPAEQFTTTSEGWYGTAFGNTGGNPQSTSNQYVAKETSEGVFQVGTAKADKGKFEGASDGFAFLFTQVEADKNFTLTVTAKILNVTAKSQAGFGLMLRDDCIIDQTSSGTIASNYVTAGVLAQTSSKMGMNFYRENGTLSKGTGVDGFWAVGDTLTLTIERVGQTVNVTVVYGGVTYTESYYDFDFFARDTEYMYVGMFANRGTVVEFSNVQFTITGESQGA